MTRRFYLSVVFVFLTVSAFAVKDKDFETKVREAVHYQMRMYPESTLKDLYKNFFQDRFGPGHIINDTAAARRYLLSESDSCSVPSEEMAELIGWEHNFYSAVITFQQETAIEADGIVNTQTLYFLKKQ